MSRPVLSVLRILIASYFLATATGLIMEPGNRTLFEPFLPESYATLLTTVFLFGTAFLIMVGKLLRVAALLLAVYILLSGVLTYDLGSTPEALSTFWRDMALLGAVLLIAVTEPGGNGSFRLWQKSVTPRRISVRQARAAQTGRHTPRPSRTTDQAAEQLSARDIDDAGDADEDGGNLFAGMWDKSGARSDPIPLAVRN